MKSAKKRYEALAAKYFETGDPQHLLRGWALATAAWWTTSRGAEREGVSEEWRKYLEVCTKDLGKQWIAAYLDERDYCKGCGERYNSENLSYCTECFDGYCYRCKGEYGSHANSNAACRCGGELVG